MNSRPGAAAAAALKSACLDAVANSVATAQAAGDGRRVIGANRKFPSAAAAAEAKRAAAKARKEAAAAPTPKTKPAAPSPAAATSEPQ